MAKKTTSLLDEIKKLPNQTHGKKRNWFGRLKESNPSLAADLSELVDLWRKNDPLVRSKFPDQSQIIRFCVGKLAEHGEHISPNHFSAFVREGGA